MTATAIYARISDDSTGRGLGVERQLQDCRTLVGSLGWTIADEYIDNDISAYSGKARPEYQRLIESIENGRVQAIVAWHPDRLHRSPRELEDFIDLLNDQGTAVATVTAGQYDLTTPSGRANARMMGTFARYESEHKSERQTRKHKELAMAGKVSGGGTRPYGHIYKSQREHPHLTDEERMEIVPAEAEVIREMTRRVIAGESLRGLAVDLNARKIPTVSGAAWSPMVIRRLLLSGRISGQREHQPVVMTKNGQGKKVRQRKAWGEIVGKAQWPAIITPEETAELRAILTDPARTTFRSPRRYLLTHLVRCHACGTRMVARPRGDKVRRYVCPGNGAVSGSCGKTFIISEPLEELVTEMALIRLESADFDSELDARERAHQGGALNGLLAQLKADRGKLDELAVMWADGEITRSEYMRARERLQRRIETAERQTARRNGTGALRPLAGAARQRWPEMSFDQRRAVLHALLAEIVIGAGRRGYNRFDPSRVQPSWKI